MKKLFLLGLTLLSLSFCQEAKGNTSIFYAKICLDVAEDSKGLGTVYMKEDDTEVMEITRSGSATSQSYADYPTDANISFWLWANPVEGYALKELTDQNGKVYAPSEKDGENQYQFIVNSTSTNEDDPDVFYLSAHFVPASELPKGKIVTAEVKVTPDYKYNTYISPVDTEIPEGIKVYTVTGVENDAVVLNKIQANVIEAYTAVLLENTGVTEVTVSSTYDDGELPEELPSLTTGLLTGSFTGEIIPDGSYELLPNDGGSVFSKVVDGWTVTDPHTCYMTVEDSEQETYKINTAPLSVLKTLIDNNSDVEIFDLEGRRLNNLQKGINIINGTKVIVK